MDNLTTIMYHYVRPQKNNLHPGLNVLEIKAFIRQLDYLSTNFSVISPQEFLFHIKKD